MKRWFALIVVLLGCLSLSAGIYNPNTIPIPENGEHPSYISNPDNILSDSICAVINERLFQLEDSTGVKTLVMVVEHVEGDDLYQFSMTVGNKYGIGSEENNFGLIIALATLDRSYQILTGRGLEGYMPDAICRRVEEKAMLPHLKEGAWEEAIEETIEAISGILMNDEEIKSLYTAHKTEGYTFWEAFFAILFSILNIAFIYLCFSVGGRDSSSRRGVTHSSCRSHSSGRSSSSGSSHGSRGGGSFGGGGSGGRF